MQFQEKNFDSFDFTSFFACTADAASDDRMMCDLNMVLKDLIGNVEILMNIIGMMLIFHGRIILTFFYLMSSCQWMSSLTFIVVLRLCVLTLCSKAHLEMVLLV